MLALSRNVGQSIIIGDSIMIKILGVKGGQVRMGISAPKELSVHREEVYDRIMAENGNEERFNSRFEDLHNSKGEV